MKYSAKDYFFKAALCHFIVDELNAKVRRPEAQLLMCFIHPERGCSAIVQSKTALYP